MAYAAGLSLSGVPLLDGRYILLNPDALTYLSVNNLLPGVFNPGLAVLDKAGEAQGSLNVSMLPPLGLPVHLVVVVLYFKATAGIAVISDPTCFRSDRIQSMLDGSEDIRSSSRSGNGP